MSTNPSRSGQFPRTSTRVHSDLFANDEAIGDEFADGLTGVGIGDFADFIRIQPDLTLSASHHGGCETLLSAEIDPEQW